MPFASAQIGSPSSRAAARLEAVGRPAPLPAGAAEIGPLASSIPITLDVALAPRDPGALERFVSAVSTPGSSTYHRYIGRGAFGARFGPTLATLHAVLRTLHDLGLSVDRPSADRLLVPIHTTVAQVDRALHTTIERFRLSSGRIAFDDVTAPLLPSSIAPDVQAVVGLSDVMHLQPGGANAVSQLTAPDGHALRPAASTRHASSPVPCASAQSTGAATANILASAYGLGHLYGLGDLGQGETIALFEPTAFASSDVSAYQSCYKTSTSVTVVPVDGGGAIGSGTLEATADIEDLIGLAPKAAIRVYETSNFFTPDWLDEWSRIVDDDAAQVISTSWLACESDEPAGFAAAEATFFEQAAAQGQTVLAADGDYGSEGCDQFTSSTTLAVDDPSSDPYVTAVGGTQWSSLTPRSGETTWDATGVGASGGGISSVWPMPAWQSGPGVINRYSSGAPCGSTGDCRETPDVSALSGAPYYAFYCSAGDCSGIGGWGYFYGTSFATPLWAASVALSNESCAGKPRVGFLDPALYSLAASKATVFHDITTGETDYTGSNGGDYPATASYDLATGLGTPLWSSATGSGLASSLCQLASLPSWLMFHQGAGHSGVQPLESILSTTSVKGLKVRWNRGAGTDAIVLPERVRGGTPAEVEITSTAASLNAYIGTTGAPLWHFSYAPDGPVALTSAPAASEGTDLIYVGFTGKSKHAIDAVHAATGKLAWRVAWPSKGSATCTSTRSSIAAPLTVAGNLLLGQTTGGCVFALNATTGSTVWVTDGTKTVSLKGATAPTEFAVSSKLSEVIIGTTYTGSPSSGRLVALNATSGAYLFSTDRCDSGSSTPAHDGALVLAAGSRGLCAVSITKGAIKWTNACAVNSTASPVVTGATAIVVGAAKSGEAEVCAVSTSSGKLLWSKVVGAASSPTVANGVVYLTSAKPSKSAPWGMIALNATSGTVLYASDATTIVTSPAVADGWVYSGASGFAL